MDNLARIGHSGSLSNYGVHGKIRHYVTRVCESDGFVLVELTNKKIVSLGLQYTGSCKQRSSDLITKTHS